MEKLSDFPHPPGQKPWTSHEAAYLEFLNNPERFADLLKVRSPKVRWAIAAIGNNHRAHLALSGPISEAAKEDYRQALNDNTNKGAYEEELARVSNGTRRDERRVLKEFVGFLGVLNVQSAGFKAMIHTPAPEDISVVRELPGLLRRAMKILDAKVPPAERSRMATRLRVCALLNCRNVFIPTANSQQHCPACRKEVGGALTRHQRSYLRKKQAP